jgi:hypothetical protein
VSSKAGLDLPFANLRCRPRVSRDWRNDSRDGRRSLRHRRRRIRVRLGSVLDLFSAAGALAVIGKHNEALSSGRVAALMAARVLGFGLLIVTP